MIWYMNHPQMTVDHLGFIPHFLVEEDPRPAAEQINDRYRHGGGWNPMPRWELHSDNSVQYPNDPPLKVLAYTRLHNELICYYDHSWVAIIQPDRSFEICRLD